MLKSFGSIFPYYKIHKFFFVVLMIVTICDPGNNILRAKELFFIITFLIGLFQFKKYSNNTILIGSIFISLIFPLIWLFFGYLFDFNFMLEFGIMYLKAFVFFILINVSLDTRINFSKLFAYSTLLVVPLTIMLYFFIGDFESAEFFFKEFDNTFTVSKRAFGGVVFDPVVFYKTSPLLIFGLSYFCNKNRFKYLMINFIVIIFCLLTMIISGTRANMLSSFVIVLFFFYKNFFSTNKIKKIAFWFVFLLSFLFFLIPFLGTYVFDKEEQSNEVKLGLIGDYSQFWHDNILSLFLGQGIGGGFMTTERGFLYMAEPTYFEVIRMFGIVGGAIVFVFIALPIILFLISKSSPLYDKYFFMLVAYIFYVFLEIASNPLLLASTGMIVMVVVYSTAINVYLAKKQLSN